MTSQIEYYRLRLAQHDAVINSLTLDNLKITNNEPKITNNEPKVTNNEPKITNNEPKVTNNEPKVTNNEPKVTNNEPKVTINEPIIKSKKRTYEEAFGYAHDYEVVQDPVAHQNNRGLNWKDGYLENLANKK
jgi:hypothetical protein